MRVSHRDGAGAKPSPGRSGDRVEADCVLPGPGGARRASAAADKMTALDLALDKMESQMRRAADRRQVHKGRQVATAAGTATVLAELATEEVGADAYGAGVEMAGEGPLVVREKVHQAAPMTLDQALYEMELVGHDFYLYVDKESERPSVVYRRKGYDYGVIALELGGMH
ncbi:MAG: HPF/RaiA family ribosome-associated protein [Nocardioides sp.]